MIEESLKSVFVQFNFFLHNLAQLKFSSHQEGALLSFVPKTYRYVEYGKIIKNEISCLCLNIMVAMVTMFMLLPLEDEGIEFCPGHRYFCSYIVVSDNFFQIFLSNVYVQLIWYWVWSIIRLSCTMSNLSGPSLV